ncbi:MAG TPA: hypothetical protein VF167_04825 [Longimicrobiaceae bacterium]
MLRWSRGIAKVFAAGAALVPLPVAAAAQAEVAAWGNLEGVRIEEHRIPFETGICLQRPDGSEMVRTSKERQRPRYEREGPVRRVASSLGGISFRQTVEDVGRGTAALDLAVVADTQGIPARITFCVDLPSEVYSAGLAEWIGAAEGDDNVPLGKVQGSATTAAERRAQGIRFVTDSQQVEIRFQAPVSLRLGRSDRNGGSIRLEALILPENSAAGDSARKEITIRADGVIDRSPVQVHVRSTRPGRAFDGVGGNFRLQNPELDPQVIEYNLENLRVAWARVELPWRQWHPEEDMDPLAEARAGRLHPRVRQAMEMARELKLRGMTVVVSIWFPPDWAIVGGGEAEHEPGEHGDPLDPAKMAKIYESIADYLVFLKEAYGVEAAMFSFNESDLGIDVRQTAEEHAALIRGLGAYFGERGLATGMLFGDTSDATAMDFIVPAMRDPEALRYVDAVSFHSWRGWTDEILSYWGEAARQLNVPLLVGEGSTDAGAWRYPAIFSEPAFALEEIQLYVRMMALAQPLSILQWQLTSDYSLLVGGGVFGDSSELRPTQRFWNLKQLASSPRGFHLPTTCDHPLVSCAAVGNIAAGEYAVHLVNDGAARGAVVSGLPPEVSRLRVFVTDSNRGMEELESVPVVDGSARVTLPALSFTTLVAGSQ